MGKDIYSTATNWALVDCVQKVVQKGHIFFSAQN